MEIDSRGNQWGIVGLLALAAGLMLLMNLRAMHRGVASVVFPKD